MLVVPNPSALKVRKLDLALPEVEKELGKKLLGAIERADYCHVFLQGR
jgi:hypothetical protein